MWLRVNRHRESWNREGGYGGRPPSSTDILSFMNRYLRTVFCTVLVALALLPALARPAALSAAAQRERSDPEHLKPEASLPFTDQIRRGRLANGLEYFVRSHGRPENTVVLRLVVDAGSVQETAGQEGLAHFVEHMAFNGTEEFGEGELVAYLESLGMRFGPDVNAYTSFDETVYKLEIPADDEEALNRGFRVMQQWASALTFEEEAIESERGVIVEEWRRGRGASARIMDRHIPVLLQDSRYAERLPIGDMDVVRTAPRQRLVDYFERWYRPDNMALIAVGDLPLDRLEALVREHLGDIPAPQTPLHRPYFFVPSREGTRVSIASDPEATRSTIAIYITDPPHPMRTVGDYRSILVRSLLASIINERFREISRDPDSPLLSAGIGWSRFLRDTEITVASASVRDERIQDALEAIVTELERAERYGVLESELDRARARFMQSIEDALVNARTQPAGRLADELVRHWLQGEPVPGIEYEFRIYEEFLPTITLGEVNARASLFTRSDDRVILAGLRDDGQGRLPDGSPLPTEEELLEILFRTEERPVAPPVPEDAHSLLMEEEPEGGEILEKIDHREVETREYRLSNGMRLFVRPSDLKEDEILFSAFSPGGLSLVPDDLVVAARIATDVARESGIGALDATALERVLAGRSVELGRSIGDRSETMRGSTRRADLEELFQLVYLAYTAPRFEERALNSVRRRLTEQIRGAEASPQGLFGRRFQTLYAAGDPRLLPLTLEDLEGVTLEQVEAVYRDRFGDPADFALFLAGSLDPEQVKELAERYLAGISPLHRDGDEPPRARNERGFLESVRDNGYRLAPERIEEELRAGTEPVAQVGIIFHSDRYRWSREENHRFNSLADLLNLRLRDEIREDAGGTYGIGAAGWRHRDPAPHSFMQVFFGMDPERTEELVERTLAVIEEIRVSPASEEYLQRIRAQQREQYRRGLQENSYWLSSLEFSVQHGRDLSTIPDFPELIESLTAEDIRATAERYLHRESRIQLLLLPGR